MDVTRSWNITIFIPEEKKQDIIDGFRKVIDPNADMRSMKEFIAHAYCILDHTKFVEGIGYLEDVGIKVEINYDDFEVEFDEDDDDEDFEDED